MSIEGKTYLGALTKHNAIPKYGGVTILLRTFLTAAPVALTMRKVARDLFILYNFYHLHNRIEKL